MAHTSEPLDTLIVGGGPAGLSAAIYLARYDRSVLVFDSGHGRSTHAQRNRNYLGFPDGVTATELRTLGRKQLERYERTQVLDDRVIEAGRDPAGGFRVGAEGGGQWVGRTLVLATGVLDHYPRFAGWEAYVGVSMFWCSTCDGYESRGKDVVVVGHTDIAAAEALQLRSLAGRVRVLTNCEHSEIGERASRRLAAAKIEVIDDRIGDVEGADSQVSAVRTEGGLRLNTEAIFSLQGMTPRSDLSRDLGLAHNEQGYVLVDAEQKTSAEGVYACGDLTSLHSHQVSAAVHQGAQAASAANYRLCPAELKLD